MTGELLASVVQMRLRASVEENLEAARAHLEASQDAGARVALLPEYFFLPEGTPPGPALAARADEVRAFLQAESRRLGLTVLGNTLEHADGVLLNVGYAFTRGAQVARQPKVHPMPGEAGAGISGGRHLQAFDLDGDGVRGGILVCADILYPEAARVLGLQGVDLLFNPVLSPYRADDVTQEARSALYIARAYDTAAFVLKAGAFTDGKRAVGRSLVAAPWGVLARYRDEWQEEVLTVPLDLAGLRAFRATHRGLQDRNPAAYGSLLD